MNTYNFLNKIWELQLIEVQNWPKKKPTFYSLLSSINISCDDKFSEICLFFPLLLVAVHQEVMESVEALLAGNYVNHFCNYMNEYNGTS